MVTYDDAAIEQLIDRAAGRVGHHLDQKFEQFEKRQDRKFKDFETRQDERFQSFETRQDKKFAQFEKHQDEKFKDFEKRQGKQFNQFEERQNEKFAQFEKRQDEKLLGSDKNLKEQLAQSEKRLKRQLNHSDKNLKEQIAHSEKKQDDKWERKIQEAAERGAGIYYEQTKHDIQLVMETMGFIKERLENMVTRDEFNELSDEVKLIRRAVTDTNQELRQFYKPGWFPGKK